MEPDRALDDLKIIRRMMERTRREMGGYGGWHIMVLWGTIWFFGFLGTQFLPDAILAWLWPGLCTLGAAVSVWLGVRMGRQGGVHSSIWRLILLWWLPLIVFAVLVAWLFRLNDGRDLTLLIVLTVAVGYFQTGVFTYWVISGIGTLIAASAVGAAVLAPEYFFLVMALAGGGGLIGSGLWFIYHKD